MKTRMALIALFAAAWLATPADATLTIAPNRMNVLWYFHNTDPAYETSVNPHGYFRNYNSDDLPDYLMVLENKTSGDWRMFTIDTSVTGAEKTYAADKTAGRDIPVEYGVFVPDRLYTPRTEAMDSADLVLFGTNMTEGQDPYTKLVFRRLNKWNTEWPDEAQWEIDVDQTYDPNIRWEPNSFNTDAYPDFFVWHRFNNASNQFVVTCHDGKDGAVIWTRTLGLDPEDPGTGVGLTGLGRPWLDVAALRTAPDGLSGGDLNGDGVPEVMLYYTFAHGEATNFTMAANLNILDGATGNFYGGYSDNWTRVFTIPMGIGRPATMTVADYNKDGKSDMLFANYIFTDPATPPVFKGFDLHNRADLFASDNTDFGDDVPGVSSYFVTDLRRASDMEAADLDGDGFCDLAVGRLLGFEGYPLKAGAFHGYANGAASKGRKMCLTELDGYNGALFGVNDFNGDNVLDFVLYDTPLTPDAPTPGKVTWGIANAPAATNEIAPTKEFTYEKDHSFTFTPGEDDFSAQPGLFAQWGDVDGDGQRDTGAALSCAFDSPSGEGTELVYGWFFVYDNTPGATAPDITAEVEFKVENEDGESGLIAIYAMEAGGTTQFVDNNGDGYQNDVSAMMDSVVAALSFDDQVEPPTPTQSASPTPTTTPGPTTTPVPTPTSSGPVVDDTFDVDEEGWVFTPGSNPFTAPQEQHADGALRITATDNTDNFGWWGSPVDAAPIVADSLYRSLWTVKTDVAARQDVPAVRMRANASDYQQANYLRVESMGDGAYSPDADGEIYPLYFVSPAGATGDTWFFSFDLINFGGNDSATGYIALDRLTVYRHDIPGAGTDVADYQFDGATDGWGFSGEITGYTAPVPIDPSVGGAPDELGLVAMNNSDCFGFWTTPDTLLPLGAADTLYRLTFNVRTDASAATKAPGLRMRAQPSNWQSAAVMRVDSEGQGENGPGAGRDYALYYMAPASAAGSGLICSFDLINFNTNDDFVAGLYLDSVKVETLTGPMP